MGDLLALSSRIIDSGVADQPVNRVTQELSELADGIAIVESFSHTVLLETGDGLVAVDASSAMTGARVVDAMRGWRPDAPVHTLLYTHGHMDHVGGSGAFAADAERAGRQAPEVVAHEAVATRLRRYQHTDGWNLAINARQFGWQRNRDVGVSGATPSFVPDDLLWPGRTYTDRLDLEIGGVRLELHHGKGETDDHTWVWLPERRAVCTGDFLIWNFPNAGNPQKVQRFPEEWAATMRAIAAMEPELLLPAHGLPIEGRERIARVLDDVATAIEQLCSTVVAMMNAGATLDEIVHTVRVPDETLALPYLRPLYDEPEFVVRNVWRRYGGWWDGNAASLKPAPAAALAAELASLAGGAMVLAERGAALAASGDLRLACHLVELAGLAAPDDPGVHRLRAEVYTARKDAERSLMAKGIYADAARRSITSSE